MSVAARVRRLVSRTQPPGAPQPPELIGPAEREIVDRARPFTLTSDERLLAVIDSVRYIVARGIPGDFAECGVWKGGSVLAMILALRELGVSDRDIHLFDTFESMSKPTEHDVSPLERPALETWQEAEEQGRAPWTSYFDPSVFTEESVHSILAATGYPTDRLHFVRGQVEATLPEHAPQQLALLRLDTDWYESTRHELVHLYPRLSDGGVLIIDDYGHWQGARRAVDEYFQDRPGLLLSRIDYTGRLAVKH